MAKKPTDHSQRIDQPTGTAFVGHEWDGIEELDTPMPRWWLWTFYITIIWALAYVIMYPAWPLVNSATKGMLGWTSRGELAAEMQAADAKRAPLVSALAAIPVEQLVADQRLYQGAVAGGAAAFKVHCVQCHGSGAAGPHGSLAKPAPSGAQFTYAPPLFCPSVHGLPDSFLTRTWSPQTSQVPQARVRLFRPCAAQC